MPQVQNCVGGTFAACKAKHDPLGITVRLRSSCSGGAIPATGMMGKIVTEQCTDAKTWVPKGAYLGVIVGDVGERRAKKAVKKTTQKKTTKKAGKKTVKKSMKKKRRR